MKSHPNCAAENREGPARLLHRFGITRFLPLEPQYSSPSRGFLPRGRLRQALQFGLLRAQQRSSHWPHQHSHLLQVASSIRREGG